MPVAPFMARGVLALEPRFLFDGALAVTAEAAEPDDMAATGRLSAVVDKVVPELDSPAATGETTGTARHLLVIDNRVVNWQALANGAGPDVDVLVIDGETDGLVSIAQRMLGERPYQSLQIVSHGASGVLALGSRTLDTSNLAQYQTELAVVGNGLTADGDILLYGCDIAAGSYGADFLSALARATQADVAASTDLTGAQRLGGDWELEARSGTIEAVSALKDSATTAYDGLLLSASLTVVQSSEPATTPNVLSTTIPQTAQAIPGAIGEVIRMRAVVAIEENATPRAAEMRVSLADGLSFLNDGSATIALVSDLGMLESSTLSGPANVADGTPDGSPSDFSSVRTIRPDFVIPNSGGSNAIANGTTTPVGAPGPGVSAFGSGDDIRFVLGDMDNLSTDADTEWLIIEFNVVVVNQLSNQDAVGGPSATALPISYTLDFAGVPTSFSETDQVDVIEPGLTGVDKRLVSVIGNTATFQTSFTNSGNTPLHDVRVFDDFAGATNITFGAPGVLPGGATNSSTATALDVRIPTVAAGATVTFTYTGTITDLSQGVPSRDVQVTGTSLSVAGASLTTQGGEDGTGAPIPGVAVSVTTGERTGADGPGPDATVLNNYAGSDGAGIGSIGGHLWDDTLARNNTLDAGVDPDLGGVTVSLTWAGPDNVFGNGDDTVRTTTTSSSPGIAGTYSFGGLAAGNYRITVPTAHTDPAMGAMAIAFDVGAAPTNDGLISITLPEGVDAVGGDFAYVRQNQAPAVTAGGNRTVVNSSTLAFTGADLISVGDPDLLESPNPSSLASPYEVWLDVSQGTLTVTPTAGVTVAGNGSNSLTLTGATAAVNQALASLLYTPGAGFVGNDTLDITVNDGGNIGDFDGDLTPGEQVDDNRQATRSLVLTVAAPAFVNNPPVAPSHDVVIAQNATLGMADSQIVGMPAPSDPDQQPLTITVLSLPAATSGQVFLADGTPVQTGQSITIAQLQSLQFLPNRTSTTPPGVDGLIPAGALLYRAADPLGASADGAINIRVNPSAFVPPLLPPAGPPVGTIPLTPTPVPIREATPLVPSPQLPPYADLTWLNTDFDPYQPWTMNTAFNASSTLAENSETQANRVSPSMVKAANLVKDDTVEKPKPKAKAKVLDRGLVPPKTGEKVSPVSGVLRPSSESGRPFSEQVKAARKPFSRALPATPLPNNS